MKKELICSKLERESCSSSSNQSELDTSESSGSVHHHHHRKGSSIERMLDNEIHNQLAKCSMLFPAADEESLEDDEPTMRKNYFIELNTHEFDLIKEIECATETAGFYDENRFQLIGEVNDLIYALNLAETYIMKTVKFCKALAAFRTLNQEDQLIMLKDFFTELILVRFCYCFNPEKDGIPVIEVC